MSLRILFADDSVTAQNMGKKILTEAGYEVVAVSNGAAAVKKIAEQKPDIIILDVYMPGYSGLEVCEKVRGSMETMKTPVLLTVGKLEPYRPEDANRVKADGVIVKPFEASDLLAIVKKFEERIGQVPVLVQQPVLAERSEESEIAASSGEPAVEHPVSSMSIQPTVEVPDHMATTAAFSDLLGSEPAGSANHFEPVPPPMELEAPTTNAIAQATVPDYELPVSWREPEQLDVEPAPAATEPAPPPVVEFEPEPRPQIVARPLQIPVYQERGAPETAYELMPTSAPPLGEIEIPREPQLQESAAEATRNTVAEALEPGLLSTGQQFEPALTSADAIAAAEMAPVEEQFTPAGFQDIPAEITSHLPQPPVPAGDELGSPEPPAGELVSDADFEARVAAALSAYGHNHQDSPAALSTPPVSDFEAAPSEEHEIHSGFTQEPPVAEVPEVPAPLEPPRPSNGSLASIFAAPQIPAPHAPGLEAAIPAPPAVTREEETVPARETVPVFEYRPPVGAASEEPPAPQGVTQFAIAHPENELPALEAQEQAAGAPELHLSEPGVEVPAPDTLIALSTAIESALPPVAAEAAVTGGAGADPEAIAQAVHRVMERLKPELVEEIIRELQSKKE